MRSLSRLSAKEQVHYPIADGCFVNRPWKLMYDHVIQLLVILRNEFDLGLFNNIFGRLDPGLGENRF